MTELEPYLHTFFKTRNGISITAQKGINYEPEELSYMMPFVIADKITNIIVDYEKKINNIPFIFIDLTGGLGSNTLSALDNPNISHVYTYEKVPERQKMLKTNVESFNLQNKWTQLGEFTGILPEGTNGCAIALDPPWLSGKTGLNYKKEDYIHENAEFAGKKLEEWLPLLKQASIITVRLPPFYVFHEVKGWKIIIYDDLNRKKNNRLIICLNLLYFKHEVDDKNKKINSIFAELKKNEEYGINAKNKSAFSQTQQTQQINQSAFQQQQTPTYKPKYQPKEFKSPSTRIPVIPKDIYVPIQQPKPIINELINNPISNTTSASGIPGLFAPIIQQKPVQTELKFAPSKIETSEQKQDWEINLKTYLHNLLLPVVQDENIISKLLAPEYFQIWKNGFTEMTYDSENNYDLTEITGDSVLDLTFTDYLLDRLGPEINEGKINEQGISSLTITYLSKFNQAQMSTKMGLTDHVRTNPYVMTTLSIAEDLLESFFGCLFQIGNKIKKGFGYILCYNFVVQLYKNIEFDKMFLPGPAKTSIQQMFKSLGWGSAPETVKTKIDGKEAMEIYLTDSAYLFMLKNKINIPKKIGVGIGYSDKAAESQAYTDALKTLYKYGLNYDWVNTQRFNKEFNEHTHPEYAPYLQALKQKMKEDGYNRVDFEFPKISKGSKNQIIQLKAYRPGYQKLKLLGTEVILNENDHENNKDVTEAHIKLIKKYIGLESTDDESNE
jgi:dsRNA-specific ribonuclease